MRRSKHSLSHYKLLTCDMGKLVPVGLVEALPGDTFQQSTSALIRMSPLLAPVMHPVTVRIHHWFVPNRLLHTGWEDFITGGPTGTGTGVAFPTYGDVFVNTGDLLDYLGVPTGLLIPSGTVSKMPVRAYNKIFNDFYRDEDLVSVVNEDTATVQRISWEKDYFSSARPWAQKGPAVTLPLGATAPITGSGVSAARDIQVRDAASGGGAVRVPEQNAVPNWFDPGGSGQRFIHAPQQSISAGTFAADLSSATAAAVTDIRKAFALQRYQEARAQYGSRYTEYLRYLGITPSDARLQRAQYLGGGKQTVAFSEVLRTGNVAADVTTHPIGQMKGHGIAAMKSNRYRYFCEEHGYIVTLMSIRPRTMYVNGIHKTWVRRTKEDYYQKELELIGQQEVKNWEVFCGTVDATNKQTFGYQDRYAEYRHQPSGISGDFRTTLDYWHLGRKFTSLPTLNNSFVECDPSKRVFAEQSAHSCWVMVSHSIQARRMVGKSTIGRIL